MSETLKENPTGRIDPEYFNKAAVSTFRKLETGLRLADFAKDGYRVVYENTKVVGREEGDALGLPYFLQSADITTPFINVEKLVCVSETEWERYPKGRVKEGELLIEVKGKAAKIAVVPPNFPPRTLVTGTCFKLNTKEPWQKSLLVAHLTGKYGGLLKDRLKTNLLVAYIAKGDLYRIPIPNFSNQLNQKVHAFVEASLQMRSEILVLQEKAEATLLDKVGLANWVPANPLAFTAKASTVISSERLDPEHFMGRYELSHRELEQSGAIRFEPLGKLLAYLTNGHTPLRHNLQVGEIPFLAAEHVGDFTIQYESQKRILKDHHEGELARTALKHGDVLMTIKGRIGNAALVEDSAPIANINQDVALLRFKATAPPIWYVLAFLNCSLGKLEIRKWATGQINPFLGLQNLKKVEVPIFEDDLMQEIADTTRQRIDAAFKAKNKSSQLLTAAARAVEIAIEDGEPAALAYLDKVREAD